jgi:hypothetical protein
MNSVHGHMLFAHCLRMSVSIIGDDNMEEGVLWVTDSEDLDHVLRNTYSNLYNFCCAIRVY